MGRRAQQTVSRVLEAARAVLLERGYAGTTIDEIARRAEVSRGSVYTYFPGKREILVTLGTYAATTAEQVVADFAATHTERTPAHIREFVDRFLGYLDEHGAFAFTWFQASEDDDALRTEGMRRHLRICRRLAAALDPTIPRREQAARGLAAYCLLERTWSLLRQYGDAIDGDALRRETARMLHRALEPEPPGRRR